MENETAAADAAQRCRISIEDERPDGGWETTSVEVYPASVAEQFLLLLTGLSHAMNAGEITPDQITRIAAGWIGVDPDAYSALPLLERFAFLYAINGGGDSSVIPSVPPGETVN